MKPASILPFRRPVHFARPGFLPHARRSAFTLVEIVLVVSIILVLLGLAISRMGGSLEFGREVRVKGDIQAISTALRIYNAQNGFYPTTEQGLKALIEPPATEPRPRQWRCAFDDGKLPRDPWDSPYQYACPGKHNPRSFDLSSPGPDRIPGTADDIGNWDNEPPR